jgi:hypothetical protein
MVIAEIQIVKQVHKHEAIILTSRADSVTTRLGSCAVAALVANARRENPAEAVVSGVSYG